MKRLGLDVVAEGVETEAQYQFLKQSHCQLIQGYYFYQPMCADELIKVLENVEKNSTAAILLSD